MLSESLYGFLRGDVCDKYIEAIKPRLSTKTDKYVPRIFVVVMLLLNCCGYTIFKML